MKIEKVRATYIAILKIHPSQKIFQNFEKNRVFGIFWGIFLGSIFQKNHFWRPVCGKNGSPDVDLSGIEGIRSISARKLELQAPKNRCLPKIAKKWVF